MGSGHIDYSPGSLPHPPPVHWDINPSLPLHHGPSYTSTLFENLISSYCRERERERGGVKRQREEGEALT
jgi:hypothetical protein